METLRLSSLVLIAVMHFYFMYLETVLWTTPKGLKIFNQSKEKAEGSRVLALNQGFYNGFLASGLLWSTVTQNLQFSHQLGLFFLGCVIVAGVVGGVSVHRKIFWVQAGPALISLLISILGGGGLGFG